MFRSPEIFQKQHNNLDLFLCQVVQFIHQTVNLLVSSGDVALQDGVVMGSLGGIYALFIRVSE